MKNFASNDVLPFVYVVGPITLASSANGSQNLTLEANSWFELHYLMASSDQDADTDFIPNQFTVQITDQSSGRQLTSGKVPQRCLVGPSNHTMRQIRPVVFPPNAVLQFDFTNLIAGTNIVTLTLHGYKIFNQAAI